jgi:hypothetical protein
MKEQRKRRSLAEQEALLSLPSEPINEIPPDMNLRVLADWNRNYGFVF